ncbi:GH1 family beta-glucosidase [Aminiphilus sp.]|jgi:beta-glucosidase|uniref:GH1 family beta-glucosidase n=1 Tax=Aminiphilus sp. TaxID=1872488 RepID=UPI00262A9A06|nr:GH1 family beta-glucosidase [Aminiphilus sp.]
MTHHSLDLKALPKDFLWGVATAAYQIEGAVWANGRGCSIWDTYCRTPGKVYEAHNGDVACDHYHRWEEDLDLMKELGIASYRFSVAWPRIFPRGCGAVEPRGLDFYDRLVDGILRRGLVPMCTLYHWDLPQELEDRGGWPERDVADHFADYAETVLRRLGDRLPLIVTFNEPYCICFNGYYNGSQAPGRKNLRLTHHAAHTLNRAHVLAMDRIRAYAPGAKAGIVMNTTLALPATDRPEDRVAAELLMDWEDRLFLDPLFRGRYPESLYRHVPESMPEIREGDLDPVRGKPDFFGLNYYFPSYVVADPTRPIPLRLVDAPAGPRTAMGWCIVPSGLTELLLRLRDEYAIETFYITENGSAWNDVPEGDFIHDEERQKFLVDHLDAVIEAVKQGVDVRGYYAWSVYDNFEWTFGFAKRFGLYYTDYLTQRRIPKDSARLYKRIVEEHRTENLSQRC